jgi:hypothetical protein
MKNKILSIITKSILLILIVLLTLEVVNLYGANPILRYYSIYEIVLLLIITLITFLLFKKKQLKKKYFLSLIIVPILTFITMFFAWWPISADKNQKIDYNNFTVNSRTGDLIHKVGNSKKVLIVFTGAKVDPLAMYYLIENNLQINVVIIKSPHNMALLSLNAANEYINQYEEVSLLGYSLGGTAAVRVAKANQQVKNLFLLASYSDLDLSQQKINVYQYLGDLDGTLNQENLNKYTSNYSSNFQKVILPEFNHSSFALLDKLVQNDNPYKNDDYTVRKNQIDLLANDINSKL